MPLLDHYYNWKLISQIFVLRESRTTSPSHVACCARPMTILSKAGQSWFTCDRGVLYEDSGSLQWVWETFCWLQSLEGCTQYLSTRKCVWSVGASLSLLIYASTSLINFYHSTDISFFAVWKLSTFSCGRGQMKSEAQCKPPKTPRVAVEII